MTGTSRDLRRRVLARVKPKPETTRRAKNAAAELGRRIRTAARAKGHRVTALLVGSVAKDTHARPLDVDLFILFPEEVPREALEKDGVALSSEFLKDVELRYAEHPYAHGRYRGFAFDVVPAYRIDDPQGRKSAVDRTPFHTSYVRRRLPIRARDQVRLLKAFLKGVGAYGAETAVGGFSGYLTELLILKYGAFDDVLNAAAHEWEDTVKLALADEDTDLGGCFVFVDPVDHERNAAAAVVPGQLDLVKRAARAYTEAPSLRFFFPRKPSPPARNALAPLLSESSLTGLKVPRPDTPAKAEIPHLERLLGKVKSMLKRHGFDVPKAKVVEVDGAYFLAWDTEPARLPDTRLHRGPPAGDSENTLRFQSRWNEDPDAHGEIQEERGRLWVEVKTRLKTSRDVVEDSMPELLSGTKWTPAQVRSIKVIVDDGWQRTPQRRLAAWRVLKDPDPWTL